MRTGDVGLLPVVLLVLGLAQVNLASAQNEVPNHIKVHERPAENPAHYAEVMSAAQNRLLVMGQYTGDGCESFDPNYSCPVTYLFEKQGDEWVTVQKFKASSAGINLPRFLDDNTFYIHRTEITQAGGETDFHEIQMFVFNDTSGQFEAKTPVTFDEPQGVAFDGTQVVTTDRWSITFIEYDPQTDSWTSPDIIRIADYYPENNAPSHHWVAIRDGVAYFMPCKTYSCGGGRDIAMIDFETRTLINELFITEFENRRHTTPYFVNDKLIVKNWNPTLGLSDGPKNTYKQNGPSWSWDGDFDSDFEGALNGTILVPSDTYLYEIKWGTHFDDKANVIIMYEEDPDGLWKEVGLIVVPNGNSFGFPGYYEFFDDYTASGQSLFIQHEGDNTLGYRIFEIPDVSYYLDSDKDKMPDGWEAEWNFPTDSFDDYMNIDTDVDKLSDAAEFRHMTSPRDSDTDNDGIDDGYEVGQRLDPLDSSDARVDYDNDGVSTLQEYRDGTDPYDPMSFKETSVQSSGGGGGAINLFVLMLSGLFCVRVWDRSREKVQLETTV